MGQYISLNDTQSIHEQAHMKDKSTRKAHILRLCPKIMIVITLQKGWPKTLDRRQRTVFDYCKLITIFKQLLMGVYARNIS